MLRILLVLGAVLGSSAISSGPSVCDVHMPIGAGTTIMKWAEAPTYQNFYTVRSGDGTPTDDPTTYVPGSLVPIHIRTLWLEKAWKGLVLYAVRAEDPSSIFGEFRVEAESNFVPACNGAVSHINNVVKRIHEIFYWQAPSVGAGPVTFKVLIKWGQQNTGAFYWPEKELTLQQAADPRITGFTMSMSGSSCAEACQNVGSTCVAPKRVSSAEELRKVARENAFLCQEPMLEGCSEATPSTGQRNYCYYSGTCAKPSTCDTKITNEDYGQRLCECSGVPPPPTPKPISACDPETWIDVKLPVCGECSALVNIGNYGTCEVYCDKQGLGCLGSAEEVSNTCTQETAYDCQKNFVTEIMTSDAICECDGSSTTSIPTSPPTLTPGGSTTTTTIGPEPTPDLSGASPNRASSALLGIATLLLPTYGGRQNLGGKVVVAAVLGGLSVVRAHNWMSSPSRSNFEATQQSGCLPKTSDDPHLVLGLDQKFPLAFTMGHGANPRERSRSSWIAFVRAADEEKLTTMRYKEDGEQYLNNIPDNALRYEGPEWVNFYFEGTQFRRNGGLLGEFENTGTGSNTKVQAGEPGYFDWADNMAGKDFYEQCEDPGDYCKQDDGSDCNQWRWRWSL